MSKHDNLSESADTALALVESLRAIKYMQCVNCGKLYNNNRKTHKRLFGGCREYKPAGELVLTPEMVKLEAARIKDDKVAAEIDATIEKILREGNK